MEKEKDKTLVGKVWEFFASVKFAIVIFALISLTSIIGTVLEQRAEPAKNMQVLVKLFGESLAPTMYSIFNNLGFMDMYRSWWFMTLLILFSVNIVICSVNRLPRIWKMVREPIRPLTEEQLGKITMKREVVLKGKPDRVRDTVTGTLKAIGFNYGESKEDKGYQFYSQKGSFTRLGVYITHLSILLILSGALIGIFFGFKGSVNIPEGGSYAVAFSRTGPLSQVEKDERHRLIDVVEESLGSVSNAAMQLGMDEKSLRAKMRRYGIQPIGFSIRNDDFNVDFYEGSDMPKEYKSWLTIIDNGKEVMKKSIEVNDPLTYKGVTFYQASYGMVPRAQGMFVLKVTSQSGVSEIKQLQPDDTFIIPGTNIEGTIKDFSPALARDKQGKFFTYTEEMMNNPAVFIDFKEGGKEKYSGWILKRYPVTGRLPEGHIIEFVDLWGAQYTGLQVRKDPGVWVVYLGCITIAIGLFMAFFMSHRKLWVRVVEEKNNTRVVIGATSNKNRAVFERKINKIVSLLSKRQEGGK